MEQTIEESKNMFRRCSGYVPVIREKMMKNDEKRGFSIFRKRSCFSGIFEANSEMVVGDGFEPSKSATADLQSAPFGRSGTPPLDIGAGEGNRTLTISLEG